MARPTFESAKSRFPHRFTMEHVPAWARLPHVHTETGESVYYKPHFRTDREWYDSTLFHGESDLASRSHCYTSGLTWPMGQGFAAAPFRA